MSQPETALQRQAFTLATAWRRPDSERGFADPLIEQIALRFRLLGEPLRLKLVAALANGERSVGELVELTGAGQPNVSKHLAALAQGGLVHRRKVGLVVLYSIADPLVLRLCDVLCAGVQESIARQAQAFGLDVSTSMDTMGAPSSAREQAKEG